MKENSRWKARSGFRFINISPKRLPWDLLIEHCIWAQQMATYVHYNSSGLTQRKNNTPVISLVLLQEYPPPTPPPNIPFLTMLLWVTNSSCLQRKCIPYAEVISLDQPRLRLYPQRLLMQGTLWKHCTDRKINTLHAGAQEIHIPIQLPSNYFSKQQRKKSQNSLKISDCIIIEVETMENFLYTYGWIDSGEKRL